VKTYDKTVVIMTVVYFENAKFRFPKIFLSARDKREIDISRPMKIHNSCEANFQDLTIRN